MESTTVAVDLAKDVIEIAVQGDGVMERRRLSRKAFGEFLVKRPRCRIVMEACGGAHHWARLAMGQGHDVKLLPAIYVRAYRRRRALDPERLDYYQVAAGLRQLVRAGESRRRSAGAPPGGLDASPFAARLLAHARRVTGLHAALPRPA